MNESQVVNAKGQLSKLLTRMERGEEILFERDGRPVARLIPYEAPTKCKAGEDDTTFGYQR